MNSFFYWAMHNEALFKYIIGCVLFVLWAVFMVVGLLERKRLSKNKENIEKYENEHIAKLKYVQEHMDIFGVK